MTVAGQQDGTVEGAPGPPLRLSELRQALAEARIATLYQPIVRMSDRRPLALEVLARLEHPSRGVVVPDLFVPQIENAGLGWPLTQAVTRRAFADWGAGRLRRLGLSLALNFPLDILLIPAALSWLDQERAAAGIPAEQITIELTESQPVERLAELRAAVASLRRRGYRLAIDDVGPDIRDHRALLALEFSSLKLDKDLVQATSHSDTAMTFVKQTLAAAHSAGMSVVAEGISDKAIWARMLALGVEQAQGFLISRPIAGPAVAAWHCAWCGEDREMPAASG